jgi:pyrimidine-nucleoside phosphorylase
VPSPVEVIRKKRDGERLSAHEIKEFFEGYLGAEVADYQVSAWLMAAVQRGLDEGETEALTRVMLRSGKTLPLRSVKAPKVDKHSTGGVGDKITLCLAPLVAACGIATPMIAGRGLGHTGGTLDKLEAIPGFRVRLGAKRFEKILRTVGACVIGQSKEIAPLDRRLYALRDVTGTVESIPLIVASILSKKLAVGSDALVLDVKVGRGAFMRDRRSARELARALVRTARRAGLPTTALITDMSQPIGLTIGNALEVREAIDVLRGDGPRDTRELTLALGAEMLRIAGRAKTLAHARTLLERALADGSAFERFLFMVRAQGGDVRALENPKRLPHARVRIAVRARKSGVLAAADPLELGMVAVALGAGRARTDDHVDPGAGIELCQAVGEPVRRGEPLAFLSGRSRAVVEAQRERALRAFRIGKSARRPRLILERVDR